MPDPETQGRIVHAVGAPVFPQPADLESCLLRDREALRGRVRALRQRARLGKPVDQALRAVWDQIRRSQGVRAQRQAQVPNIHYPPELPVSERRAEVAALIAHHPVVVLCGETGSGKSTQLPKLCLELGRGIAGRIGHTQPRRIAARSLASRVAQELGGETGGLVGYKVRFHDRVRPETSIKLMTDGILLAEIQQDRLLSEYDTLIIDEAHERSLNIDFLLGYLRGVLARRADLKLIVTSATIDPQRFARHFADRAGTPAPIIEISGRTYPVEVRYRPPEAESAAERDPSMQQAISDAVGELARQGSGDVLVFLSGEREIRETAETLRKQHPPSTEILPLFARQGPQEQARVFQSHAARRVILATNVAETSLTVPGIRYVVDPGFARISRYSHRTKVQRLPVERISRASAEQRKGRCGRVAAGVCIRLYSEDNFASRAPFTEPEIARTNLAAVILQMKQLGFGAIEHFPFVDPPDSRLINDGYRTLEELAAIDAKGALTPLGRQLARLPVDPRLGRMLFAAAAEQCLAEVLVIAAALSVQDPRERPFDKQQAADQMHAAFAHPESDFLTLLNLWQFLEQQRKALSRNKFIKLCQHHFLSWTRVQEWRDTHAQLRELLLEMGFKESGAILAESTAATSASAIASGGAAIAAAARSDAPVGATGSDAGSGSGSGKGADGRGIASSRQDSDRYARIHRALLAGLLSNIGFREAERELQGARNSRFFIHPSSVLFAAPPKWVMVAERVETSRQYGRTAAKIQPAWVEQVGRHLLQRSYAEPHWQAKSGQVAAYEKVTLYGVVLVPKRRVNYGPINPAEAREIFLRFALVGGDFHSRAPFWRHNQELIQSVHQLEAKSRRRDILVDEEALYAFYAERVPSGIYSAPQFEQWLRQATHAEPKLLHLRLADIMQHSATDIGGESFPDSLQVGATALPLEYQFDPGAPADGVTLVVPLPLLNQVSPERLDWLVPGLLEARITALLRGLPKALRKVLVPLPDTAAKLAARLAPSERPLLQALGDAIKALTGLQVPEDAWDPSAVPEHLRMKMRVVDAQGAPLVIGEDPLQLRRQLGERAQQGFAETPASHLEREGLTRWDFGDLPEQVEFERGGIRLRGYPALVDQGDRVAIRVLDAAASAAAAQRAGLRRLLLLHLGSVVRPLRELLTPLDRMRLQYAKAPIPAAAATAPIGTNRPGKAPDLADELVALILDLTFTEGLEPLRTQAAFLQRLADRQGQLLATGRDVCARIDAILGRYQALRQQLASITQVNWLPAVMDIQTQLDGLVFRGFIQAVPYARLRDYPRYLQAIAYRIERLGHAAGRDRQWMAEMAEIQARWRERDQAARAAGRQDARLEEIRWLLEELRVALFAQQLGTPVPVSVKRVQARWQELGL